MSDVIDPVIAQCARHGHLASKGRFADGTVFGDWRLTAFIGRGGSGEVYCAEHLWLGTSAAVKILVKDDESAKARFEREAKLLSQLRSSAFPQFYAYGKTGDVPYIAMELLEPGEPPTGDKAVAEFLLNVCKGVAELHAHGLVHRDIKPGNILWRDAEPVIADFGLVKPVPESPSMQPPDSLATIGGAGTPGYGAPEQMERGETSFAADIHALGVLANHCFGGNPPRQWKRIIQRATSSIPAHRYSSVDAFARAIRRRNLVARVVGAVALSTMVAAMFAWMWIVYGEAVKWRWMGENIVANRIERVVVWNCDERFRKYDHAVSLWNTYSPSMRKRLVRYDPTNLTSAAEIPLDRETMDPRAREWFDRRFPTNQTYATGMPHRIWATVTNAVDARIVRLGGAAKVFRRPLVLNPKRECLVIGPGILDAAVDGATGAVMRLKNCVFLNRTRVPLAKAGMRYFLEGDVYLNFLELDRDGLDWDFILGDRAKNEIRYRGPETIQELNAERRRESRQRIDETLKRIKGGEAKTPRSVRW